MHDDRPSGFETMQPNADRASACSLSHSTLARLRIVVTLGIFVVYPACTSVQHESSTTVAGYGAAGVTGDSSFDCDGDRTGTVRHRQVGAGGEVVHQARGALGGGARAAGIWGHVSHHEVVAGGPTDYGLGNLGVFITGDYEWVGQELGLGITFQLNDRSSPIPSPWYRVRLGRKDRLFTEITAGSRDGLLLSHSLAEIALGVPGSFGTLRLGLRWGGRAIVSTDPDDGGLTLALNSSLAGDVSVYLETQIHVSEKLDVFASFEGGGQLPAIRLGVAVHLGDAAPTCGGACSNEPDLSAEPLGPVQHERPRGAGGLTPPPASR